MVYPTGYIITSMESNNDGICIFKAQVGYYIPHCTVSEDDKARKYQDSYNEKVVLATGTAYEKENSTIINKTSYIENCETSAVGRALGMAGFGIDTSVASAEEVQNAIAQQTEPVTLDQIEKIKGYVKDEEAMLKYYKIKDIKELTKEQATKLIARYEK